MFRPFRVLVTAGALLLAVSVSAQTGPDTEPSLPMPEAGEDGTYVQPWFHESFLDLGEDLAEATGAGKRLAVVWEQRGCPYCKLTHEVNLRIPKIVDTVKDGFVVLQLNLWGSREVTDFDGEVLQERDLAKKWGVQFTPTFQFFPEDAGGKPGKAAEVLRIPGYFKPFHFYHLWLYVAEKGYEHEPSFQRWLGEKGEEYEKKGIDLQSALWADALILE